MIKAKETSQTKDETPISEKREDKLIPEIGSKVKPELPQKMAQWLVTKLDCPVELNSHEDRNNFAACVNKLIEIANWKEAE